jgi:multidrug efflux system membrane fusion protein
MTLFRSQPGWVGAQALACLALAALAGCQKAPPPQEPVRAVKLVTIGQTPSDASAEFSGEIRARVESALGFRVGGKLLARPAEIGQRVKAGQLLAQLDPQDYQVTAQAAAAQLVAAQSNRDSVEADYRRYQGLFEQGFISAAELERREAAMKAAQAQWQQARAQSTVQGNQSNYTRLLADGPGVVTAIEAQPGQVVAAGQPVVRLALDGPRDVVFSISQERLRDFKTGDTVVVKPWGSEATLQARVRDVALSADPVTRAFVVKAELPKEADGLVLGSTANVRRAATDTSKDTKAQGMASGTIKLPGTALRVEGGKTSVWVLDASTMTVKSQPVEVETADGNDAVIRSGLQVGDEVVATGVHVLTPGQKVTRYSQRDGAR